MDRREVLGGFEMMNEGLYVLNVISKLFNVMHLDHDSSIIHKKNDK